MFFIDKHFLFLTFFVCTDLEPEVIETQGKAQQIIKKKKITKKVTKKGVYRQSF